MHYFDLIKTKLSFINLNLIDFFFFSFRKLCLKHLMLAVFVNLLVKYENSAYFILIHNDFK